jgi:hypothetical protein
VHISQLVANNRRRKDLYTLSQADRALLDAIGYKKKLKEIDTAILANADFLNRIVADPEIFGHDLSAGEYDNEDEPNGDPSRHQQSWNSRDPPSRGMTCPCKRHLRCLHGRCLQATTTRTHMATHIMVIRTLMDTTCKFLIREDRRVRGSTSPLSLIWTS